MFDIKHLFYSEDAITIEFHKGFCSVINILLNISSIKHAVEKV